MEEQEALRLIIDIAIKHGKHNQKAHGRRGAAGQAYAAEYRAVRAAGGSVADARERAKKESAIARSVAREVAGEQRLKAESAAAAAARKPAADTLKRAQKELPADKAREAEQIIQKPLSSYDRENSRAGMIRETLQKGTMLGRPLDPPTRRNIQRDLRETLKRREAALRELNSARSQVEQMLGGS